MTKFSVPHGSIIVNIELKDNHLYISAPFLTVPEQSKIPLLREVTALNFGRLIQAQIIYRDNKLFFEYSCPLELADPFKMFYIFDDICYNGDKYDDEFITQFGAERIYTPKIEYYDQNTLDYVYDNIQLACNECLDNLAEYEKERKYGWVWSIISTSVYKILYFSNIQGQLMNDFKQVAYEINEKDISTTEAIDIGRNFIIKLKNMTKEQIAESLYKTEIFVSSKRRSNLKNIQYNLEEAYKTIDESFNNKNYIDCYLRLIYNFYKTYYYNDISDDINALFVSALKKSSAQDLNKTAVEPLYTALRRLMNDDLTPINDNISFLAKLFGKNKKNK
jgi:hypothetical protein